MAPPQGVGEHTLDPARAMSQQQPAQQQLDQQRYELAEHNRQSILLAEEQRHVLAEQQRIAEQERYETRQEMQRMAAMMEQQQQQQRLDEQRRHFPSQYQQPAAVPERMTPAPQPAPAPRAQSPDPASLNKQVSTAGHKHLGSAMHKLRGAHVMTDMLAEVHKHRAILDDPNQTHQHESAFHALLGHVGDKPAAHDTEIDAKNRAAESLHQHIARFPHKRDDVIDALCKLDDEFNAHEAKAAAGGDALTVPTPGNAYVTQIPELTPVVWVYS